MINILLLQFNTLAAEVFNAKLARANLVAKANFNNTASILNNKFPANKTKNESIYNELKRLKTLDSKYFIGKSHFEEDGMQNYLIFQPINRYFKVIANKLYISSWISKGLPDETIMPPVTSDNSLTLSIDVGNKIRIKLTGSCLKQPKTQHTHGTIVNIYVVYELGASGSNNSNPTLKHCLFRAVTLTKNADIGKYGYSGYGFGQNVLIFGTDMSSSVHINNKEKDILVLGKGPTQGLEHTLTAEKMYSINFTVTKKKFCLSLYYNGANSYLFINGKEIYEFKAKDSEIVSTP